MWSEHNRKYMLNGKREQRRIKQMKRENENKSNSPRLIELDCYDLCFAEYVYTSHSKDCVFVCVSVCVYLKYNLCVDDKVKKSSL